MFKFKCALMPATRYTILYINKEVFMNKYFCFNCVLFVTCLQTSLLSAMAHPLNVETRISTYEHFVQSSMPFINNGASQQLLDHVCQQESIFYQDLMGHTFDQVQQPIQWRRLGMLSGKFMALRLRIAAQLGLYNNQLIIHQ